MNPGFKLIGDMLHVISIIALLVQIRRKRSVSGLSYRTQEAYLLAFLTRYYGVFVLPYTGAYLLAMKLAYIGLTAAVLYYMRVQRPISQTYEPTMDKFPHYMGLYLASVVLTIFFHASFRQHELYAYLWSFSIILESLALLPQISMLTKSEGTQVFTASFVGSLGLYRLFYVLHWLAEAFIGESRVSKHALWLEIVFGCIQSATVADFTRRCFKRVRTVKKLTIPI